MRITSSTLAACAMAFAAMTAAQRAFVTTHSGTFNGRAIRYVATVGETILKDDKGVAAASFVSTSYVRDDETARDRRPVMFAFNGGPGSASPYLHLGALGPKRIAFPADVTAAVPPVTLVDNPESPLDVADVVMIDPVETGYSRILPGGKKDEFYTAAGDAKWVARFIESWIAGNGRSKSPIYVLGESYGTIRAVFVADELTRPGVTARLDGVILLGQAVNIVETVQRAGSIVGAAVNLPTLTAIAWYHGRIDKAGRTLTGLLDECYAFAMSDYLTALAKGVDLPGADRARIAKRLAELTGLKADFYLANDLAISKERFREELLKDKGLVVGRYDARYTGPVVAGQRGTDPSAKLSPPFVEALKQHLASNLRVTMTDEYRSSDRAAGNWDYGGARSPFADYDFTGTMARVMRTNANLRLFVGTGLYDTTTTTGAARYFVTRGSFPPDRVETRAYEGGHMFYTNDAALGAFSRDLRAFVSAVSDGR